MNKYIRIDDSVGSSTETDDGIKEEEFNPCLLYPASLSELEPCVDPRSESFVPIPKAQYCVTFHAQGIPYDAIMSGLHLSPSNQCYQCVRSYACSFERRA